MFCRTCASEVNPQAVACPKCGCPPIAGKKFCQACGGETQPEQVMCVKCSATLNPTPAAGGKTKVAAGVLAILLGWLGVHKFYLGYTKEGIIMLAVSVVGGALTCGAVSSLVGVVGLIEGIIYLTKSDAEFEATYVQSQRPWF